MGVVGAAFLAVVYRSSRGSGSRTRSTTPCSSPARSSSSPSAGNVFGAVFSRLGTATVATDAMLAWQIPPVAMLTLIMVIIFLLGWPFEWPAIILVFVPLHAAGHRGA